MQITLSSSDSTYKKSFSKDMNGAAELESISVNEETRS